MLNLLIILTPSHHFSGFSTFWTETLHLCTEILQRAKGISKLKLFTYQQESVLKCLQNAFSCAQADHKWSSQVNLLVCRCSSAVNSETNEVVAIRCAFRRLASLPSYSHACGLLRAPAWTRIIRRASRGQRYMPAINCGLMRMGSGYPQPPPLETWFLVRISSRS